MAKLYVKIWLPALTLLLALWPAYRIREARQVASAAFTQNAGKLAAIPLLTRVEKQVLRRHLNATHLAAARRIEAAPIAGNATLDARIRRGRLVRLSSDPAYRVAPMAHSEPFVTPEAYKMIDEIGRRFHRSLAKQGLPPFRFVITSATRTIQNQKLLARENGNAAISSSHTYGASVDIHYRRFDAPLRSEAIKSGFPGIEALTESMISERQVQLAEEYPSRLQAALGRVLIELQEEGKLVVIYERGQPVYHVTATPGSRIRD